MWMTVKFKNEDHKQTNWKTKDLFLSGELVIKDDYELYTQQQGRCNYGLL
jgi:hypothetical protein